MAGSRESRASQQLSRGTSSSCHGGGDCESNYSQEQQKRGNESWISLVRISSKIRSDASFSRVASWCTASSCDDKDYEGGTNTSSKSFSNTLEGSPDRSNQSNILLTTTTSKLESNKRKPKSPDSSVVGTKCHHHQSELQSVVAASLESCETKSLSIFFQHNYLSHKPPSEVIVHPKAGPYAQLCFNKEQLLYFTAHDVVGETLKTDKNEAKEEEEDGDDKDNHDQPKELRVPSRPVLNVKIVKPQHGQTEDDDIPNATPVSSSSSSSSSFSADESGWSTGKDDTTNTPSGGGESNGLMESFLWMDPHWYYHTTELENNDYAMVEYQSLLRNNKQEKEDQQQPIVGPTRTTSKTVFLSAVVSEKARQGGFWRKCFIKKHIDATASDSIGTGGTRRRRSMSCSSSSPRHIVHRQGKEEYQTTNDTIFSSRCFRYVVLDN